MHGALITDGRSLWQAKAFILRCVAPEKDRPHIHELLEDPWMKQVGLVARLSWLVAHGSSRGLCKKNITVCCV